MKQNHKISTLCRRLFAAALAVVLILGLACSAFAVTLRELDGLRAGVMSGTPQDEIVESNVQNAQISYYNSVADLLQALKGDKIDFFVNSTVSYMMMKESFPELIMTDEVLKVFDLGVIFPKSSAGEQLCEQMNEFIARIEDDGTLDELKDYWLTPDKKSPPEIPATGENGTLNMATCSTMQPFSYISEGQPAGLDVALVAEFCREYGYGLKIDDMDFAGMLSGVEAGKYDLAASQIAWTEERAQNILYSDVYATQDIVAIMVGDDASASSEGFFSGIAGSFVRNFVTEARWKMIVSGLWNTLMLTVLSVLAGSILGYGICLLRCSKNKAAVAAAKVYIKIFQGTPIVVLLLIMYYIIFGNSRLPGFWVAVAAFGLNFAAYGAEVIRSGIESIDPGQREAALALGYTERQSFYRFVLPQALVRSMPVMKGQVVSLLKGTSVVGYIAIRDLTRAADIIRSRTYEAFFPLLVTAVLYFVLAWVLTLALDRIEITVNPRRRKKETVQEG